MLDFSQGAASLRRLSLNNSRIISSKQKKSTISIDHTTCSVELLCEGSDSSIFDTTGHNVVEPVQVSGAVEGQAMERDAMAHLNACVLCRQ